jgi:hypothetical protein
MRAAGLAGPYSSKLFWSEAMDSSAIDRPVDASRPSGAIVRRTKLGILGAGVQRLGEGDQAIPRTTLVDGLVADGVNVLTSPGVPFAEGGVEMSVALGSPSARRAPRRGGIGIGTAPYQSATDGEPSQHGHR